MTDETIVVEEEIVNQAGEQEVEQIVDEQGNPIIPEVKDPWDLELDTDPTFGEYNVSEMEGYDPENLEQVEMLEMLANEAQELGMTQEQMEYVAKIKIAESGKKTEPKELTPEDVKKSLNEVLNRVEKRNYKATKQYIADSLKGTEHEEATKAIANNPHLIKIFHALMQKQGGKEQKTVTRTRQSDSSAKKTSMNIPVDKAFEAYTKFITENSGDEKFSEKKESFFKGMMKNAINKKELEESFKEYMN
jgi:hypothetical protein